MDISKTKGMKTKEAGKITVWREGSFPFPPPPARGGRRRWQRIPPPFAADTGNSAGSVHQMAHSEAQSPVA